MTDPSEVVAALRAEGFPLKTTAVYTAANYPALLAYPGKAPQAGVEFTDPSVHRFTTTIDDPLNGSEMVEVYSDAQGARGAQDERGGYGDGNPGFREWDLVNGPAVLRIAGTMTARQAKAYCLAFEALGPAATASAAPGVLNGPGAREAQCRE